MKKVLLLITALLTAPGLVSADLWDELSHDANSVSHVVTHQANIVSHVVSHQTNVLVGSDIPSASQQAGVAAGVAGHAVTLAGKTVGHFVLGNLATMCRMAMGTAMGSVIGSDCGEAVAEFAGECSAELDSEAPEVGITACTIASGILTRLCKHELTQAVAGNAIHQSCDHLAD